MTNGTKPAFPQTPDGVTDWEKVFEDPDEGLVAVISKAQSVDALKSSMAVVIKSLYTRKTDELEVARLMYKVEELCQPGQGGASPQEKTIDLLREIKAIRIHKARVYLAQKAEKAGAGERRTQAKSAQVEAQAYQALQRPKFLVALLAMAVVMLGAIFVVLWSGEISELDMGFGDGDEAQGEAPSPSPQPAPAKPAPAERKEAVDPSELPPAVILRRLILPKVFANASRDDRFVLPVIMLGSRKSVSLVCRQTPKVKSILNVELSKAAAKDPRFGPETLSALGQTLATKINELFTAPVIQEVILIENREVRRFTTPACRAAPPEITELLDKAR